MAGIDVKMGVSGIAQFKSAMQQGAQSVKTLDAALKKNEAQYKATGDAETYMQQKTQLLQKQIAAQQEVCSQAEKALEAMTRQGVDPASRAYQQMQQNLLNAQTALLGMQTDLNGVSTGAKGATDSARQMNTELKNIGKQVDYQAVINGIDKITDGMEKAATSVVKFAGDLWSTMRDAATWADDQLTLAQMYGISVEDLQRMEKTAEIIDTPVEAIIKARQKLSTGLSGGFTAEQTEVLSVLGLTESGKYGTRTKSYENAIDMLWDVGEALNAMGDSYERDAYAQTIFGRSWMELQPLFRAGRQAYDETMASWSVVNEENVNNLGELDDAMTRLEGDFETVKMTALSSLAPAFTSLANSLAEVLSKVNEYLNSDEGKEKMEALGNAITELFQDLTNVDTGAIVDKVSGALDTIKGVFEWIRDNKKYIVDAIRAIGLAFVGLKAAEIAATLTSAARGFANLLGNGTGNGGGSSGTTIIPTTGGGGNHSSQTIPKTVPTTNSSVPSTESDVIMNPNGKAGLIDYIALFKLGYDNALPGSLIYQLEGRGPKLYDAGDEALFTGPDGQKYSWNQISEMTKSLKEWGYDLGDSDVPGLVSFYTTAKAKHDTVEAATAAETEELKAAATEALYDTLLGEGSGGAIQTAAEAFWDAYKAAGGDANEEAADAALQKLFDLFDGREDEYVALAQMIDELYNSPEGKTLEDLPDSWFKDGENPELPVDPVLSDDAQGIIQQQLDGVTVHVQVIPDLVGTGVFADDGEEDVGFANGLPWVPHDGFYKLHGGERVMTAAQNRSYTNNSNIYFDHVNVGGGVDADGLAARIAERTRRAMSGFGG